MKLHKGIIYAFALLASIAVLGASTPASAGPRKTIRQGIRAYNNGGKKAVRKKAIRNRSAAKKAARAAKAKRSKAKRSVKSQSKRKSIKMKRTRRKGAIRRLRNKYRNKM